MRSKRGGKGKEWARGGVNKRFRSSMEENT